MAEFVATVFVSIEAEDETKAAELAWLAAEHLVENEDTRDYVRGAQVAEVS